MDPGQLKSWLDVVLGLLTLVSGLLLGLWAYAKYVLERGLLPPVQFNVDCTVAGLQGDARILEILLHLQNVGGSALIATNIQIDVLYLNSSDPVKVAPQSSNRFGRLDFTHKHFKELRALPGAQLAHSEQPSHAVAADQPQAGRDQPSKPRKPATSKGSGRLESKRKDRGIPILSYDTFVQPKVDQVYPFVTAVPGSASYVLVWASFEYAQHPSLIQRFILWLSRKLGLIQFSLSHVSEPHTTERLFKVDQVTEGLR